jgi:hypothetical protein
MGKIAFNSALVSALLLGLLLGGCGSDKKEGAADPTATVTKVDNSSCTSTCHAGSVSKVASAIPGASIPTDWAASKHATANAADCQDCHGGGSNHWGLGPIPSANPDTDKVCVTCHAGMPAPHTNSVAPNGEAYPASYINSQTQGKCRLCHNPHNPTTLMAINVQWASSGKGRVTAAPWEHYDFKIRGTSGANPANSVATDCVRCHTTTGLINYISSNFANISPWGKASDTSKETLQCNGCHDKTYDYTSQRSVGAVQAFYNYSSKNTKKLLVNRTYSNIGKSNLCLLCHVGRESGDTLTAVAALPISGVRFVNYTSQAFINSHYLTGGATLFGVSAYPFPGMLYVANSAHTGVEASPNLPVDNVTQGPCVTCHMQKITPISINGVVVNKPSHLFTPELVPGGVCLGCHGAGFPPATPADVTTIKSGYGAALLALKVMLQENPFRKMYWGSDNPYFFNDTNGNGKLDPAEINRNNGTTKWHSVGSPVVDNKESGMRNLGAAFNYNLLAHDTGAFAHNPTYVKQIIFDSIDWLDDNVLPFNGSIVATINALTYANEINPVTGVAFTPTEIAAQKAAAIAYLNGGTRP